MENTDLSGVIDPEIPQVNLLIPLYNEEEVFAELTNRLINVLEATSINATVIMIDDGSKDKTPFLMRQLAMQDKRFVAVFLSRNFGHQLALTAGLNYVDASEAVMILDGDLQDPPELLDRFYEHYQEGYDVVYAVRKKRKENIVKRLAYKSFYLLLRRISNLEIPLDSGDFSMISRKVVDQLNNMKEESRFIRGMRSWIGFNQIGVEYDREKRASGESKYTIKKLFQLALNGIFNFSEFPIKFIFNLGLTTTFLGVIYLIYTLYQRIFLSHIPEGFTSLIIFIVLFGGIQLISIGLLGEYILRIFFQTKNRPLFVIRSIVKKGKESNG